MPPDPRTVVVTGANGFIGRNLCVRLREIRCDVVEVGRDTPWEQVRSALMRAEAVYHLAGANRPGDPAHFLRDNVDFSSALANAVAPSGQRPLLVFASSVQAAGTTLYGASKRQAEDILLALEEQARVSIWRLPNVFGKWARPDYNSAVATFCHNIARGLPIRIDDGHMPLDLVHVDDLLDDWLALLEHRPAANGYASPKRQWSTTVGDVAQTIQTIADDRRHGRVGALGSGLQRALYATFMSYLPDLSFRCALQPYRDTRGSFAEILKTDGSGQISYLTAHPGITRGGHYHHAKVEKFVVVQGEARFRFRQIVTGQTHEISVSGAEPSVIETVPGWTHDITNVGTGELIALVWASEVFDPARPDTVALPV